MKYEIQSGMRKGGKGTRMERNIDVKIVFLLMFLFSLLFAFTFTKVSIYRWEIERPNVRLT